MEQQEKRKKMAGRPKKKPDYDAKHQLDAFLEELTAAYQEADSLRTMAAELDITPLKLRKLLITAGAFSSETNTEVCRLREEGKSVPEIMDITGLSRASVHSYLPYIKGMYNAAELSTNAERCRTYRERQDTIRKLQQDPSEENLWCAILAFQNYAFKTAMGLPFRYRLRKGKNGEWTRELWVDRREKSKSLAWSSILLAFRNSRTQKMAERPKALGDIRGVSYIYPILWRFGLICVPEKAEKQMGK